MGRWGLPASDLDERVGLTVNRKSCGGRSWDTGRLVRTNSSERSHRVLVGNLWELVMAFQIHIKFRFRSLLGRPNYH